MPGKTIDEESGRLGPLAMQEPELVEENYEKYRKLYELQYRDGLSRET